MTLIQCDECHKVLGDADTANYQHNSEYDFDACSQECYQKLCLEYYGGEE